MSRTTRRPEKDGRFFAALSDGASVSQAARRANYGRASVYEWREADESFRAAWDEALEEGTDLLEDEAFRRAHDGVPKPIFYKGDRIDTVHEHSDTLTIFLLKARRPDKFKERTAATLDGGEKAVKVDLSLSTKSGAVWRSL